MKDLKDKILLVLTPDYPDKDNKYYGAIFVKNQLKHMSKYFKKVIVISQVPRTLGIKDFDRYCKDYKHDNTEVYFPRFWHLPTEHFRKSQEERRYQAVKDVIDKNNIKFDLIHAHFIFPVGYTGVRLKQEYGVPLIVTGHGIDVYDLPFKNKYWSDRAKFILKNSDKIIVVSDYNVKMISKLGFKNKVLKIDNGYNGTIFKPMNKVAMRKKLNLPQDKKIILTVGSILPIKGQIYLIEAVGNLVKKVDNLLCIIVGSADKATKDKLEKRISELGIEKNIMFTGSIPEKSVPYWVNACDLFVLPSLNEGSPGVMFEALGCGKPFIGTNVGSVPQIINSSKIGFVVEKANPKQLEDKILLSLNKKWDRKYISNYGIKFSWKNITKEIMKVYQNILG